MNQLDNDVDDYIGKGFNQLALAGTEVQGVTFEGCTFTQCELTETCFKRCRFIDCEFIKCNFSLARMNESRFMDVTFSECKLIGIDWTQATWSELATHSALKFYQCTLNDSSFWGLQLEAMVIEDCKADGVDFREGDFTGANFSLTNLSNSLFARTNLTNADFADACYYNIDIFNNTIAGARFTRMEALSLLEGLDIVLVD